jgi:RimK family alpha-L-glutamate ligase
MRIALIAARPTPTNDALAGALIGQPAWEQLTPQQAIDALRPGDGAIGRLDVLTTLDGVDDGLWALGALAARGVRVLNDAPALLAVHDKLLTARILRRHGIAHPRVFHVREGRLPPPFTTPVVVKPRFGSWGKEVHRCDDEAAFVTALSHVSEQPWFREHGVVVQQLVPSQGYDLRVVVVAGRVLGSVYRISAPGEWRTNVALGAVRHPVSQLPRDAASLALAAASAAGTTLVGVDLLPTPDGGWTVMELNGAVEFTQEYSEYGDVFAETALVLERELRPRHPTPDDADEPTAVEARLLDAEPWI